MKENSLEKSEEPKNNLNDFYQALSEYEESQRDSFGGFTEEAQMDDDEFPAEEFESLKTNFESKLQTIIDNYEQFFSSIGCKLNIIDYPTNWKYNGVGVELEGLIPTLEDGDKFISFLGTLRSGVDSENESLKVLLKDFEWHLFKWSGIEHSENDSYVELISSSSAIKDELLRIDPVKFKLEIKDLTEINKASDEGYLWEYVEATKAGLLYGPDSSVSDPLGFHHSDPNITGDQLKDRWMEVFKTLDFIYKNEKARELYKVARSNVERNLKKAVKEIDGYSKGDQAFHKANRDKWLAPIKKVEQIFGDNY